MNDHTFDPEPKDEHRLSRRQLAGRIGEDAVARRYEAEGYTVVARNVHMSRNELDLILRNETHIIFVEVKTRHISPGMRSRYGRPADAVNAAKRARTVEAAEAYLRENRAVLPPLQPRIDVAEVYMTRREDGTDVITDIKIFRNAFGAR